MPNRLVFEETAPETLSNQALSQAKLNSADKTDANAIIAAAEALINANTKAVDAVKREAVTKLKANKQALEEAQHYITNRLLVSLAIKNYESQPDFLGKREAWHKFPSDSIVKSLKKYNANDNLESKYQEIWKQYGLEIDKYYQGLIITQQIASNVTRPEIQALIPRIAMMQQAIKEDFPDLPDQKRENMKTAYPINIQATKTIINPLTDKFPELQKQLTMLKFASDNLEAAQKEKKTDGGHLEGANQYMDMIMAEQEARYIWGQLPIDSKWRLGNIDSKLSTSQEGWTDNSPNWQAYNTAVEIFKQAKDKESSAKSHAGDSVKATDLFRKSANFFRKVLTAAVTKEQPAPVPAEVPANIEVHKTSIASLTGLIQNRLEFAIKSTEDDKNNDESNILLNIRQSIDPLKTRLVKNKSLFTSGPVITVTAKDSKDKNWTVEYNSTTEIFTISNKPFQKPEAISPAPAATSNNAQLIASIPTPRGGGAELQQPQTQNAQPATATPEQNSESPANKLQKQLRRIIEQAENRTTWFTRKEAFNKTIEDDINEHISKSNITSMETIEVSATDSKKGQWTVQYRPETKSITIIGKPTT